MLASSEHLPAYVNLCFRLDLLCAVLPQGLAAVWVPSGLLLAVLVFSKRLAWPIIILAMFLANLVAHLYSGHALALSLSLATVNSLEPALAAWGLVRYLGTPITLRSRKEVIGLLWVAAIASNALTAGLGAAVASLGLEMPFWDIWRLWWFANAGGILIVAPVFLTWAAAGPGVFTRLSRYQVVEGVGLGLALLVVDSFVFGVRLDGNSFLSPLPYMTFPCLLWAALRFGPHGAATASLVLAAVALWRTAHGLGPFASAGQPMAQQVFEVQLFLGVAVLSSLMAAAVTAERTQTEEALRQSESLLSHIINNTPAVISVKAIDGSYLLVNNQFEKLFGVTNEHMQQKTDTDIFPPDIAEQYRRKDQQVMQHCLPLQSEEYVPHPDGLHPYIAVKFPLLDAAGSPYATCNIATDITARTQVEEHLKGALRAKETLLKEIHHRVKNNLQIIASLLNLQAKQATTPGTLDLLQDSQHRIRAMALLHEYLYRSVDLDHVDAGSYLRNVSAQLLRAYRAENQRITVHCHSDEIALNIETAIPCGLIVNELVSNALKHAFPGGRVGVIDVSLRVQPDEMLCLIVRDDGVGIPLDLDVAHSSSLGVRLVHMLTRQLQGTLALERHGGTTFTLRFAELHYQERT